MRDVNLLTAHRKLSCCNAIGIAGYKNIYSFRNKAQYVNYEAVNPGLCEKMEACRVPPERTSCTTSGTRTTGWELLL